MINITNKVGRQLWRIEVDREMQLLERSPIKKWTSFLYSQYSRAAALIAVGRVDDIDFIFADDSTKMAEMLLSHSRTVGNKFSQKAFSILSQRKFINPHSVKTPLDEFWGSFNIWMKENAAQKVTGINKTTKKSLAAMIKRGMEQQQTTTEISKNIREAGKITAPHRAKTIALTETHAAAVKSMDVAVKASRIEMEKEWVGAKDMRTRRKGLKSLFDHFHAPPVGANGERVPMDKKFIGSGEPMDHPGDINGSAGNVVRCLTNYGTPIYTSAGWKQVRYIKPGDLVLTHKNRFRKVLRTNKAYYKGEVVRIDIEGNKKFIIVTPEHPFLVISKNNSVWKEAKDIKENDVISFMASYCQHCGKPIPFYNKFCNISCSSKKHTEHRKNNPEFAEEKRQVALKQWQDPNHRKNISKKVSDQMHREFANGTRNKFEITKKARQTCYDKYGPGGSMAMLNKDSQFREKGKRAVKKKYGSYYNMLKKFAFPALGKCNFGGSKIEQAMADFLTKKGKKFKTQFSVGRRRIDFYIPKEKLFIEVDGYPWHEDKEYERKRDLEVLTKYPDHRIAHVDYKPIPPKWEFFDLLSLNHTGTFKQVGMKVVKVSTRQLERKINIYNFAVEDDESYIANGFVTHNCRCVLMYHTVKLTDTDRMKPYEPVPDVIGLTTAQTDAIKYCNKAGKIDDKFIDDMLLEYPGFEKDDILKLSKYIETHIGTDAMPLKINRGLYTERAESFCDILQNGKMKNQFQLSAEDRRVTSGGRLDSSMGGVRDRWEKNIFDGAFQKNPKYIAIRKDFGYKFTKELADERPVYGYIECTAKKGLCGQYGEVSFQLREGVKERTTFTTINSSIVREGRAESYVGTYKNNRNLVEGILKGNLRFSGGTGAQKREAVARLKEEINDVLKSGGRLDVYGNGAYVEIQVHGGIDLAQDVAHMSFPTISSYDHIAELAKKYNIPFDRY